MALSARGEVYVWGRGEYGRLGLSDPTGSSKLRAKRVASLEGHVVVQVRVQGLRGRGMGCGSRAGPGKEVRFGCKTLND